MYATFSVKHTSSVYKLCVYADSVKFEFDPLEEKKINAKYLSDFQRLVKDFPDLMITSLIGGGAGGTGIPDTFAGNVETVDDTWTKLSEWELEENSSYTFDVQIAAREAGTSNRAGYKRSFLAHRVGTNPVVIEGTPFSDWTRETNTDYDVRVITDGNKVVIQVKGVVGQTIKWELFTRFTHVSG